MKALTHMTIAALALVLAGSALAGSSTVPPPDLVERWVAAQAQQAPDLVDRWVASRRVTRTPEILGGLATGQHAGVSASSDSGSRGDSSALPLGAGIAAALAAFAGLALLARRARRRVVAQPL